jgi:heme-degrading monooxygenase HmoA
LGTHHLEQKAANPAVESEANPICRRSARASMDFLTVLPAAIKECRMFSVIFEVNPKDGHYDHYLGHGKMLRPELEKVDGFIDNIRYRSLTREGWLLSLSSWRDEKAVVRWRIATNHHKVQAQGRTEILSDYHLRVGQLTADTEPPAGYALHEQRLDETVAGAGTTVTLVTATRPKHWPETASAAERAAFLGLNPNAAGLLAWDVFDAVLSPGDLILLISWRDRAAAEGFENTVTLKDGARLRRIQIVRDYGMFDRREAPQYYPDAKGRETIHS